MEVRLPPDQDELVLAAADSVLDSLYFSLRTRERVHRAHR